VTACASQLSSNEAQSRGVVSREACLRPTALGIMTRPWLPYALIAPATLFLAALFLVPLQVVLAMIMGLMLQRMSRGRDAVLWIWTIPLGISDLAAGLGWRRRVRVAS